MSAQPKTKPNSDAPLVHPRRVTGAKRGEHKAATPDQRVPERWAGHAGSISTQPGSPEFVASAHIPDLAELFTIAAIQRPSGRGGLRACDEQSGVPGHPACPACWPGPRSPAAARSWRWRGQAGWPGTPLCSSRARRPPRPEGRCVAAIVSSSAKSGICAVTTKSRCNPARSAGDGRRGSRGGRGDDAVHHGASVSVRVVLFAALMAARCPAPDRFKLDQRS